MFRRPAVTLLLITHQNVVRADFSGGPRPALRDSWESARPDFDDLPSLVEAALSLGGRPGRKVFVLAADLWTQTLAMQARAAAKLSGADLSRALGFEVETLSGLSAFEAIIGQTGVPSRKNDELAYWIVQVKSGDRQEIEDIIRRAGGRLAGLCHPGGLPHSLSPEADGKTSWQRVELWPDVIVCLHAEPGESPSVHLINSDPRQDRWHAEEEDWRGQHGRAARREMFLTTGEFVLFGEDGQPRPASIGESRKAWLAAWAEELARRTTAVPLIRPAPRPLTTNGWLGIAACVALVTAGLCAAHASYLKRFELEPLRADIERLRMPVAHLAALDQQTTQREKELAELRKQCDSLQQSNETLQAQRQRLTRLLAALADHRPEHLLVQKIEGELGAPVIHGVCLSQNEANQLASRLGRSLAPDWQIRETKMKAQHRRDDGGPFLFQVLLQMTKPGNPPPSSPGKPGVKE